MGGLLFCKKHIFQDGEIQHLIPLTESNTSPANDMNLSTSKESNPFDYQCTLSTRPTTVSDSINAKISDFQIVKILGRGTFGKVYLVKLKQNNKYFAMKVLDKKLIHLKNQIDHTKTERKLLEKLNHPFIIKLIYAFQDKKKLYFLTDFMQGGDLFYHIKIGKTLDKLDKEKAIKFYMSEILLGLKYMHENKIIYRDLKPENILIDKTGHIKLSDFGLSKILDNNKLSEKTYTICGTKQYIAPEILKNEGYNEMCDWYSYGVLLYFMFTGTYPLINDNGEIELLNQLDGYSNECKDLVKGLLNVSPKKRLGSGGINEIKNHQFFKGVDFNKVKNKLETPPFIPVLKNEGDLRYFDNACDEDKNYDIYNDNEEYEYIKRNEFEEFSYQPCGQETKNIKNEYNSNNYLEKDSFQFEDNNDNNIEYENNIYEINYTSDSDDSEEDEN